MTLAVPVPLAFGRFKQLPQRTNEVWQGGLVRLPAWIDHPTDPEGEPYRPVAALWVSLRTGLVHLALPPEGTVASAELALAALLEFGLKHSKGARADSSSASPSSIRARHSSGCSTRRMPAAWRAALMV
jgi:hypothetical protein